MRQLRSALTTFWGQLDEQRQAPLRTRYEAALAMVTRMDERRAAEQLRR